MRKRVDRGGEFTCYVALVTFALDGNRYMISVSSFVCSFVERVTNNRFRENGSGKNWRICYFLDAPLAKRIRWNCGGERGGIGVRE